MFLVSRCHSVTVLGIWEFQVAGAEQRNAVYWRTTAQQRQSCSLSQVKSSQVKSSQVAFNKTMTIALHVHTRRIKKRQQKTQCPEKHKNSQLPTVNTQCAADAHTNALYNGPFPDNSDIHVACLTSVLLILRCILLLLLLLLLHSAAQVHRCRRSSIKPPLTTLYYARRFISRRSTNYGDRFSYEAVSTMRSHQLL